MTPAPTWSLENEGSFASIHVRLPPHTKIHCESDAVVTFSGIEVQGILSGGTFWSSLCRVLFGGESFFTTQVQNNNAEQVGTVMLANKDPGGIALHTLHGKDDLLITSGAYVASDAGVTISTELQKSGWGNSLLSGTGFFLLRASSRSTGTVACAAYGSIHKYILQQGEKRSVDNGHLVAWSDTLHYRVGLANARAGMYTSMTSGEGLMCHFEGPGALYVQSHKPGEAETVVKKGKRSGNQAVTLAGTSAFAVLFLVFAFMVLFYVAAVRNGQIDMTNSNGYGNRYSSSTKRIHPAYRVDGEF